MRLYNKELEQIKNDTREARIQMLAEKVILFLVNKYGIDETFLRQRLENLSIVEREGKTHFVEYNGQKREISSGNAASFVAKKKQQFDGQSWNFENAIYTNDNNGDHTITHELIHYFSANTEMDFDTNNIGYDKIGISILGYDREDRQIDVGMNADGLNEGITEMLAMQVEGVTSPSAYEKQVYLSAILANSQDKTLINAYFSNNPMNFKNFLRDFDKRQSSISSEKLVSLSSFGAESIEPEILRACLEYSLSFCQNMEQLTNERKRLLPIFRSMSNNLNIDFTDESFDLKNFFDMTLSEKRRSIQSKSTQELGKETLDVLKETAYIDDTQKSIDRDQKSIANKDQDIKQRE